MGVFLLPLISVGLTAETRSGAADTENAAAETDPRFSDEINTRRHLMQVSLARAPADLIIRGATVLNVFTNEWLERQDIVVSGERIASVGPAQTWPGEVAQIVDASGLWAVPGFGESHKHIESSYLTPEYEAALVIPMGNTWTAEGSHEIGQLVFIALVAGVWIVRDVLLA